MSLVLNPFSFGLMHRPLRTVPVFRPVLLHRRRSRLFSSSPDESSNNIDIDKLAQQLSKAATHRRKDRALQLPDSVFELDDFEIVQTLGYLTVKIANSMDANSAKDKAALIAHIGRYFSGQPHQFPVLVLMKEFLPITHSIAENEFQILQKLVPLPDDPWVVASGKELNLRPPVVPLLGCFRGAPLGTTTTTTTNESKVSSSKKSLWFVYKWEGLKPLSAYFSAEQITPGTIWPWAKSKQRERQARQKMIRKICKGLFEAVQFCHERGVVHGSLGSGSILLSTFDDHAADELVVKLDNFGFASKIKGTVFDSVYDPLPLLMKWCLDSEGIWTDPEQDIKALGLVFLELVILSLAECEAADSCNPSSIERLAVEIFNNDFESLQEYCRNEPDWHKAVELLDQRNKSGWKLLHDLLRGETNSAMIVKHPFLN
eukprot:g2324.t1